MKNYAINIYELKLLNLLKYMISQSKSCGDLSLHVGARKKMIKVLTFLIKSKRIRTYY